MDIKNANNKIVFSIHKLADLTYNDKIKWTFLSHVEEQSPHNLFPIESPMDTYISKINDVYELTLQFNFDTCHLTIYCNGQKYITIKSDKYRYTKNALLQLRDVVEQKYSTPIFHYQKELLNTFDKLFDVIESKEKDD